MPERAAVPILREALQDPVDDVRLLAYALLDDKQEVLTLRIRALLAELEAENDPHMQGLQHARVAGAYWEMAWLGLAEMEVRTAMLENADRHYGQALMLQELNAELHFQRGRVRLLAGHLDGAERSFQRAMVQGMPLNEVMPYLAEVAFERRDFSEVAKRMAAADPVKLRGQRLAPVADFWL
jgi:tetratricopeptide (TPR) repeat protein